MAREKRVCELNSVFTCVNAEANICAEDEVRSAASVLLALMNQDAVERSRGHKRKYASGPDEWTSAICAKRTRIGTSQGEDDTDRGEEEVAIVAGPMRRPILKLRGPKQQVEDASDAGKASHKKAHPAAAKAPKRSRNWQTDGQFRRSFVVALDAAITASPSSSLPNSTSAPLSPPSSRTTSSGSENTSLLHRTPHGDEGVVTQPEVRTRVGRQSKKARKYGD